MYFITSPVLRTVFALFIFLHLNLHAEAQKKPAFKVIGFFTAKNDRAHITFVHEANKWFHNTGIKQHFQYDSTDNWNNLNDSFLKDYQVVLFLDTRPETQEQRSAFQKYMERGGAWIGFHFAAFALDNSDFPQNWDWYHNVFLDPVNLKATPGDPFQRYFELKTENIPLQKIFLLPSRRLPVNGTGGTMTFVKIQTLTS